MRGLRRYRAQHLLRKRNLFALRYHGEFASDQTNDFFLHIFSLNVVGRLYIIHSNKNKRFAVEKNDSLSLNSSLEIRTRVIDYESTVIRHAFLSEFVRRRIMTTVVLSLFTLYYIPFRWMCCFKTEKPLL